MKFLQSRRLQVKTDLSSLSQVLSWFDDFDHTTIPIWVWLQAQLALAEGFTNAVRHAHRQRPLETLIEIEVNIAAHYLEIKVWDYGPSFNLNAALASLPVEVDRNSGGGRGLQLMRKMADVLSYTRTADDRNCLLFLKSFTPQS